MNATAEQTEGRNDTLLTVAEVADRLRISTNQVYDMFRRGELAGVRLGQRVRIFEAAVQAILDEGWRRVQA